MGSSIHNNYARVRMITALRKTAIFLPTETKLWTSQQKMEPLRLTRPPLALLMVMGTQGKSLERLSTENGHHFCTYMTKAAEKEDQVFSGSH